MNSTQLGHPSRELAITILAEVDFDHRLNGFEMRERAGAVSVTMYSVEEVVSFLNRPHPRIDFQELGAWVKHTLRDEDLADRIAEAVDAGGTDQQRSQRIGMLLGERLSQCKDLAKGA